nr:UDP-N-acetylglucosamine-dolichyl-phosphate N-acetylglucosaminephosphotransferase [Cryptococcus depauperatus CBS 7841]
MTYGHPPPILLTSALLPVSVTLILNPLAPLILPHGTLPLHQSAFPALQASVGFSLLAFVGAVWCVPNVSAAFVEKGLRGKDLLKPSGGPWIPECLGLPCASLYLVLMMLFIPFPFSHLFENGVVDVFPQRELTLYLSSLLSLFTAMLLGFIDDLFDIRWRHKLPIPIVAAVPTLLVYYSVGGLTSVVLPKSAVYWATKLGFGPIYYLYLVLLPTFTTNSINILAGINGVEVTQALIIGLSVIFNDLLFLPIWPVKLLRWLGVGDAESGRVLEWAMGEVVDRHLMSLYFMLPLVGVCAGFLWHNWYVYPAKAFPGDTFCYFTGMAFSAVAIQGHFSKTLILFFIPQIFNFILSCPQLFRLVDCPRHRLPAFQEETGLVYPSKVLFDTAPPKKTTVILKLFSLLGLVRLEKSSSGQITSSTNLTLINFLLVRVGPVSEQTLCLLVGLVQTLGSVVAFGVRYGVGSWFYGGDRR